MSDVSGYKIIITLEQKVTVYKQNMNKYKFIGDNDHLLIYIMFHVIKERIWYFQLDIHVLGLLSFWSFRLPWKTAMVSSSCSCSRRTPRSRGLSCSCSGGSHTCPSSCLPRKLVSSRSIWRQQHVNFDLIATKECPTCQALLWPGGSWIWDSWVWVSPPRGCSASMFRGPPFDINQELTNGGNRNQKYFVES